MNQRFRRNIAPVLGALALIALGIGAWALLGIKRTHDATEALHARFLEASAPWAVTVPDGGFAVFDYRRGERRCVTLSLLPEAATLLPAEGEPRAAPRETAIALAGEVAELASGCNLLEVRVFATRIPYHGRFLVHYEGGAISRVEEPVYGD